MKKLMLSIIFTVLCSFALSAQSSEKISDMLKSEEITFGQASYLIATYKEIISDESSYETAFNAMLNRNLVPGDYAADDLVTLKQAAFLCMWSMNIKGGLLYSIFKNPRYAFKELQAKGVLPTEVDPDIYITGREYLGLVNACFDFAEED